MTPPGSNLSHLAGLTGCPPPLQAERKPSPLERGGTLSGEAAAGKVIGAQACLLLGAQGSSDRRREAPRAHRLPCAPAPPDLGTAPKDLAAIRRALARMVHNLDLGVLGGGLSA
jgi:hypothetical protein